MRRLLAIVLLSFIPVACQGAGEQGSDRNYDGVFEGLNIHSRYVEKIKLFDRMAFADGQDKFVSAGLRKVTYGAGKKEIYQTAVFYGGTLTAKPNFVCGNAAVLRSNYFYPYLKEVTAAIDSDLVVVGSPALLDKKIGPEGISAMKYLAASIPKNVTLSRHVLDQGDCVLFSLEGNYRVQKTIAFAALGHDQHPSDEVQQKVVSCINRAHYLHFGFSNVLKLEAGDLVERSGATNRFRMDANMGVHFPIFFQDGSMAGKSRFDVLRAYAEQVGKAK
ncbi:hypothetical protein [Kordiimonas sp.]|uniref:hypothetical protein n=1 Tax=Kordiimonas sp. TaxID=1970157 RepID=UPI003A8F7A03